MARWRRGPSRRTDRGGWGVDGAQDASEAMVALPGHPWSNRQAFAGACCAAAGPARFVVPVRSPSGMALANLARARPDGAGPAFFDRSSIGGSDTRVLPAAPTLAIPPAPAQQPHYPARRALRRDRPGAPAVERGTGVRPHLIESPVMRRRALAGLRFGSARHRRKAVTEARKPS